MRTSQTFLVTGAAGFIGSRVVQALVAQGAKGIYALDKDPLNYSLPTDQVSFVRHNLGNDSEAALLEKIPTVDYILHLAALKHQQSTDEKEYVRSNIDGTLDVLKLGKARNVKKVVFSSSLYAHGGMHAPAFSEESLPSPKTIYGLSKLCGENLMAYADYTMNVPTLSLRYFFVYGPGQYAGSGYKSLIIKTIERILAGEAPQIHGDGRQALDYIYIDDIVRATLQALEVPARGTVINAGSGIAYSVNEIVQIISSIMNCKLTPHSIARDWTHGTSRQATREKAAKILEWEPQVSIEEGLTRTISWIKENCGK